MIIRANGFVNKHNWNKFLLPKLVAEVYGYKKLYRWLNFAAIV